MISRTVAAASQAAAPGPRQSSINSLAKPICYLLLAIFYCLF